MICVERRQFAVAVQVELDRDAVRDLAGAPKDTGTEVKLPWVHIWRFDDGEVAEVHALTDTAMAAGALGRL